MRIKWGSEKGDFELNLIISVVMGFWKVMGKEVEVWRRREFEGWVEKEGIENGVRVYKCNVDIRNNNKLLNCHTSASKSI